jgi:hypothetical protein
VSPCYAFPTAFQWKLSWAKTSRCVYHKQLCNGQQWFDVLSRLLICYRVLPKHNCRTDCC